LLSAPTREKEAAAASEDERRSASIVLKIAISNNKGERNKLKVMMMKISSEHISLARLHCIENTFLQQLTFLARLLALSFSPCLLSIFAVSCLLV
jgi:hypothetical protein